MRQIMVLGLAGLCIARSASACVVGDPRALPGIRIEVSPPACCFGSWAGIVSGHAVNVDTDSVAVILYAATDRFYIQPFTASRLAVGCDGGYAERTRGGGLYAALLVRKSYRPAATLASLPAPGGEILAVACTSAGRRIQFADRTWVVKSSGGTRTGPGPNYFSESSDNVWLDAEGRLHLRLTRRGGRWYGAEVYADQDLGYGTYLFEVEGWIDRFDPNVVFAGFTYSDTGGEADIEFSRWGDAKRRRNAQFVVQPRSPHGYALRLATPRSTHLLDWQPERIDFASRDGGVLQTTATVLTTWSCNDPVLRPAGERMRFNLWLYRGKPPRDGREVEVVVSRFEFRAPGAVVARQGATASRSRAGSPARPSPVDLLPAVTALDGPVPNPARGSVTCRLELRQPAHVQMRVFDVRGRVVQLLPGRDLPAGQHDLTWDPAGAGVDLASGVYYLSVDAGGARRTLRVTRTR